MQSNYKRLGDYIKLVDNRNINLEVSELLGININKEFMPSIANVSGTDISKYKVIENGQFAYSAMQVGRDERVKVALYTKKNRAIITPAYLIFEVIDESEVSPEYLMMWFQRPEFDRYGWFLSDSTVRASLEWDRFCEIHIPLPKKDEQKKYVAMYKGLLDNQYSYESSLEDLQLICDSYVENLIKTEKPKTLGKYIQQSDERNRDLAILKLRGVSTSKKLIQSKANITGVNFSNYKVVRNGQFVYVPDTSRRGEKIALALNDSNPCIVSAIYTVFEVKSNCKLIPEFLFLWFRRSEFDRYARYNSWGSARETFDWEEMCRVELPIPDIKVQEAIVTIYHTLETRKKINEQLKDSIKPLCPILMRGVINELESTGT